VNKQNYEEASEWLVELRVGDVDAATRERLDSWFRASPEHIRAYLELSSIWEEGSDPDLDRSNSTDALIARALAGANVIPLERAERALRVTGESSETSTSAAPLAAPGLRFSRRSVLAASVAATCLTAGLVALYAYLNPTYATGTGEQRTVHLSDGSTIELNSRSRVRVRFSQHERGVELVEGQALFKVAKDHTRLFLVKAGETQVRAVGTEFDVYRKASGTTVTVVEGRVAVLPAKSGPTVAPAGTSPPEITHSGNAQVVLVAAGEQVTVTAQAVTQPAHADVAAATAWIKRELVFDGAPLTDVAQEFNRYNVRQLVVSDDQALKDFHVTGVFSSTDPASLLRFLRGQRGISVEETDRAIRISKK
jgi:transmembrane sensor